MATASARSVQSAEERFDLKSITALILKYGFKTVVLQFPDEELHYSVVVYETLTNELPEDTDMFITADSTWGSSIDDVSAMHCDGDVLIYFGTDLSSSGTMPVIICPPMISFPVDSCIVLLKEAIKLRMENSTHESPIAIFYEPGFAASCKKIQAGLSDIYSKTLLAQLPIHANLSNWEPNLGGTKSTVTTEGMMTVGGLLIPSDIATNNDTVMIYIGNKPEQVVNILLRASNNAVLHYSTAEASTGNPLTVLKGTESKEFRERYGGVLRVKDAKIVGIIVGSMGLTADLTKDIIHRLQSLIRASHKKYYTFVMGRLNEAKLCNFPEVDIFCLVSNEDNANIKPKTFHKPVVTPFELELGLGAREWDSTFSTDLGALVGNGEEDLVAAIERVREENPGNGEDSDEEELDESWRSQVSKEKHGEELAETETGAGCDGKSKSDCICTSNAVVEHSLLGGSGGTSKGQLTVFHSAAAEYLQKREYKGLVRGVEEGAEMNIRQGQYGVAAGYSVHKVDTEAETEGETGETGEGGEADEAAGSTEKD